jgi:DNA-binding GntR family transcriptional regulator
MALQSRLEKSLVALAAARVDSAGLGCLAALAADEEEAEAAVCVRSECRWLGKNMS